MCRARLLCTRRSRGSRGEAGTAMHCPTLGAVTHVKACEQCMPRLFPQPPIIGILSRLGSQPGQVAAHLPPVAALNCSCSQMHPSILSLDGWRLPQLGCAWCAASQAAVGCQQLAGCRAYSERGWGHQQTRRCILDPAGQTLCLLQSRPAPQSPCAPRPRALRGLDTFSGANLAPRSRLIVLQALCAAASTPTSGGWGWRAINASPAAGAAPMLA